NKSSNMKYLLLRTKDFQIEQTFDLKTNRKTKKDRYYKISWKNDCEYNLMIDISKNGINENDTYLNSKGGLKCSIKKIENNCATVDTYFDGDVLSSKICKLND
ncbi:hypothetical protein, partial [Sphingobacterium paramultivorum]|uniref:hypothetical protein n=1 Tax=Sphingobacterium paramultivorum TaxID=2886510 RepID=UPI001D0DBA65